MLENNMFSMAKNTENDVENDNGEVERARLKDASQTTSLAWTSAQNLHGPRLSPSLDAHGGRGVPPAKECDQAKTRCLHWLALAFSY